MISIVSVLVQIGDAFVVDLKKVGSLESTKFKVDPDKVSIGKLKNLIQKVLSIDVEDQRLIHDHRLIRDDSKLISQLVNYNPSSINIFLAGPLKQKSTIILNFSDHKESRIVLPNETLRGLKNAYTGGGRIYFDGLELTDDAKTLNEHQIYHGAFLYVLRKDDKFPVEVKVNYDPRWHPTSELFTINSETSVEDLKKLIEGRANIPADKQKLVINESEITGNSKVISYCKSPLEGQKIELVAK